MGMTLAFFGKCPNELTERKKKEIGSQGGGMLGGLDAAAVGERRKV